jgi:hypothetical protein
MPSRKDVPRVVTPEKLDRDGKKLLEYARFAIVFVDGKPQLIDNGFRRKDGLPYAKLIVVLAPCEHGGKLIPHAVVLEIGYSRTRPYTQLESGAVREKKDGKAGHRICPAWQIRSRVRVRGISNEELTLAYPIILSCMAEIVLECRDDWKVKKAWWVDGPGAIERGIYFTVSKSDQALYRQMLIEDIRYRRMKYIGWHASCIRLWLKGYKSAYYSEKEMKRFSGVQKVAELFGRYESLFYRQVLLRSLTKGSNVRTLAELIGEVFCLGLDQESDESRLVWGDGPKARLPRMTATHCYMVPHQPKGRPGNHASGCAIFEVILERSYRAQYEIPF